ncbi:RZZ complex subunit Zw10, partial [Trinorchestia longiramus]
DLLPQDESGVKLEKSTLRLEKLLSPKTFHFPVCQISKSIVEFVDLLYESLEEACSSSAQYAGRLVCTVRNMLTLYQSITPVLHAHTLDTIPQHAALVHNNSIFISNHCYSLGHQYKSRLPPALRDSGSCAVTYTDLAYEITQMGTEVFCKAMLAHKKALLDTIGQAQGFGEVPSNSGVRQCLHQLQQLRNVWHKVLPHSVYHKAIGTLLNSVVRELIDRTLSLEDISESSAQSLTATFMLLKDGASALFPVTSTPSVDAPKHVPGSAPVPKEGLCGVRQWGKFLELIVVLGASLRQLEDRWAEGSGPLALYFTPDQAKALIRALFQNTEKRAALLAKIKRP